MQEPPAPAMAGPQTLQGTRVLAAPRLLAALGAAERQALRRGVEALGGEWQAKFKAAPTARPHVVLARDVLGETYLQVLAAARGTPVVAPAWVDACRRQARSEPFDAYKVAPLKGTVRRRPPARRPPRPRCPLPRTPTRPYNPPGPTPRRRPADPPAAASSRPGPARSCA